jgi:hypothetical protein
MKAVVRNDWDRERVSEVICTYLDRHDAVTVEIKKWVPPRSLKQNRKVHAMFDDLADFTGDKNIKAWIKTLAFWPEVYVEHAGQGQMVPKSEADLSRDEETEVIQHLYLIGAELPGFEWSRE